MSTTISKQTETDFIRDYVAASRAGKNFEADKLASKFSDILAVGGFMYGAARQIYGALGDGQFHTLTGNDTDKIKIENENERIRIEMPVQPDIEQFIGETRPRKPLGEGYLETANGRYVSGYLTNLKTPIIGKQLDLVEVYPYDFIKEMKDSRHLSIFKKEDNYWFFGCYKLIGEMEDVTTRSSLIVCKFKEEWETAPHKQVIELMKLHGSPIKRNQPRELLVMPEELYLDFGKIDHKIIDSLAGDFLKNGFSPNDSPLYQMRKLMLRDSRGLTFDPTGSDRTLFKVADKAVGNNNALRVYKLLKNFGYRIDKPTDTAVINAFQPNITEAAQEPAARYIIDQIAEHYDASLFGEVEENKALETLMRSSFQRVLVYSPLNYLGRVYLWNRDVRNHLEVKNDYVSTWSDEKITFMFHNIYAVSALDVWKTNM